MKSTIVIDIPVDDPNNVDPIAQDMINVLSSIAWYIKDNGWQVGMRNNMAVDFAIAANYFADLDYKSAQDIADETFAILEDVFKWTGTPMLFSERANISVRLSNIAPYIRKYVQDPKQYFTCNFRFMYDTKHPEPFRFVAKEQ